ncbi:sensor histidine kinase [Myxococcus xanthus DK 1622]|uniref:histidine kinase n=1 Tax=Myxococcus xanthus (strain DK1622) TaxID=246197 RepID=Q1D542_MYXXD|nr:MULTISPECIES: trifunctional serine/threonine-protein kinase/ATP-binding protein/sensor histidine kinase [Myxococcus]ABF90932.1 sensor histidine kinase [Myxococcus xanthus DK 1622]NOJ51522.1 AAA family ATPase [Myxococcus xanthus]QPM76672.1 AAA family ATPase [Myxococcus xanthus]QVW65737.1 AAA family ATPase [Myxococcus xanthus DZ2]UEO08131.1 AAA family ATPase [Myxococcus xanthus DZ2]
MMDVPGYRIGREVTTAGAFQLLRATREEDGASVILKVPDAARLPSATTRLRHEWELTNALSLDGVLRPLAWAEARDGAPVLILEGFGDATLAQRLSQGRVEPRAACRIALSLARALGAIHEQGILHRDLNPSSILVGTDGESVKLTGFTLATRRPRAEVAPLAPERLEGTLEYLSPEGTGRTHRSVDSRGDFYSMGVVLYELLTGRRPFADTDALGLIHAHVALTPAPPVTVEPGLPQPLSDIALKLLAKSPEDRYQSAYGLVADLQRCLSALEAPGPVAPFALGAKDVPERFAVPEKLYGREPQQAALREAFERAASSRSGFVLVSGAAGMGKSALTGTLKRPVTERQGHFARGKYDQLLRDTPYSGIFEAFREVARGLLGEQEQDLESWRHRLLEAVGGMGRLVVDAVPRMALVLGDQPPVPELGPAESELRFQLVLRKLVAALATREHPLVLVLDDLHWADSTSLQLLRLLLTDRDIEHLLVVAGCRSEELSPDHPVESLARALHDHGTPVHRIDLAPLSPKDVTRLVADVFPPAEGQPDAQLDDLVLSLTEGNPFHAVQLLRTFYERGLVRFDAEGGGFRWDASALRGQDFSDGVVALLTSRIRELSSAAQALLPIAAALGHLFDLHSLAIVLERTDEEAEKGLVEVLQAGLVAPIDDADLDSGGTYQFTHDRVQQAALELIPADVHPEIHARIGRLLLRHTPPERLDEELPELVSHFHLALPVLHDEQERHRVAELDLRAGRSAKSRGAWSAALRLLNTGLSLLGDDGWRKDRRLTFDLHVDAAEAAYLDADFDLMERLAAAALAHAVDSAEEVRVQEVRLQCLAHRGEHSRGVDLGLEVLRKLGQPLPANPKQPHVLAAVAKTKLRLGLRKPEDLAALPECTDPLLLATLRLLVKLSSLAFMARPLLFPLVVLRVLQLTIRHGATGVAAFGYVGYGLMLSVHLGNPEEGFRYGRLALKTLDRFQAESLRAMVTFVFNLFIRHWKEPLSACVGDFLAAAQKGQETGDIEYFGYASSAGCATALIARDGLADGGPRMDRYRDILATHRHKNVLFTEYMRHTLDSLTGAFTGNVEAREEELVTPYRQLDYGNGIATCDVLRTLRRWLWGDARGALESAAAVDAQVELIAGQIYLPWYKFFQGLALMAVHPTLGPLDRIRSSRAIDAIRKSMRGWARIAPMNYGARAELLDAERARLDGQGDSAADAYDRAIRLARQYGLSLDEGVACEAAARFHLTQARERVARTYLEEARAAYLRWGARAVVARLEREHPRLLPSAPTPTRTDAPTEASLAALDLASVIKTARALSGEIVLGKLLRKLMTLVIENAGARRGLLLLKRTEGLVIAAEGSVDGDGVVLEAPIPMESSASLPTSIIHYVVRTGETVLLHDASAEEPFSEDPYVRSAQPKSLLCSPLLKQGSLTGVLYLENDATRGAFTPERLEVLRLLSFQAAISLENADLYASLEEYSRTLERRVEERTAEIQHKNAELAETLTRLQEMQRQLVAQEKLASLGALTAGIAHELQNPLNFVNNFSNLSSRLAGELEETLKGLADRLDSEAREDVLETLQDLKQNAQRIHSHGTRASDIIKTMLRHSRKSEGTRSKSDLNLLVRDSMNLAVQGLRSRPGGASVKVETTLDPTVGVVELVASDISRMLTNILDNAFYAAAQHQQQAGAGFMPQVHLSTRRVGSKVELRIRDNGPGIPEDLREKLFHPFFTTKPAGVGTGLGLSLCHDIVQEHQGDLRVESAPGAGAEFIVTLPAP